MTVQWQGREDINRNLMRYTAVVRSVLLRLGQYIAGELLEPYAKTNAPWDDRTGNARETLWSRAFAMAEEAVVIRLAHGMKYGVFLETRWAGKYSVLWATIQAHLPVIRRMLDEIFR